MPEARKLVFRLGGVLALLALLAAGAWLALPYLMRIAIHSLAERNGLESVIIDVESVRWDHTTIRRLAFKSETEYGPVVVDLRGLTARYQLTAMALTTVTAETGDLTWRQQAAKSPTPATAAMPRFPPLPPMHVKRMGISLDSQWGRSTFSGELNLAIRADKITVLLSDQRQNLRLVTDPEFLSAAVTIVSNGESVANLNATHPLAVNTTLDGAARVHQLRKWSQGNQLIPEDMHTTLQQLNMDHGLLSVQGQLRRDADQYEFEGQGQSSWRGWQQQGMVLGGHIDFHLNVKNDQWRFTALPKSRLLLTDVHWGDDNASIDIPNAEFDIEAKARMIYGDNDWRITIDSFVARTNGLEIFLDPDTPVRTQQLEVTGKVVPSGDHNRVELRATASQPVLPSLNITAKSLQANAAFDTDHQLRAKGTFFANGVRMHDWPKAMSALSLTGQFDHHDRKITALGKAQIGKKKIAKWRIEPKDPSDIALTTVAEFDITTLWPYVKPLFDKSWDGLSFASGSFSGEVQFIWDGDTTSAMTLRGAGIKGRYEQLDFTDLDIELTSQDVFGADYDVRINIEQAKVAGEIMISDAGINFRWRDDAIELTAASLHILGGGFAIQPTILRLESKEHRLSVSVAGLDFGQVLAMIDQPGLSGSGRLSGMIPLAFVGDGIEIKDAELHSTVPGTLRYRVGENAAAPIDNIALQALQDFRYDTMKIQINYEPDGAYRIRLRLEGRNPDLYNGYPIAFNLNLSGELPSLLRDGILRGNFGEQILKDIQSDQ
jgi:hypothetical protein